MEVPRGTLIIYCKTLVNPTTTDSVKYKQWNIMAIRIQFCLHNVIKPYNSVFRKNLNRSLYSNSTHLQYRKKQHNNKVIILYNVPYRV